MNIGENYSELAHLLRARSNGVVLTGAGISAESGISTFRDQDGLWQKYDPAIYASIEVFRTDPSKYWSLRGEFIRNYGQYEPNPAHHALVELEKRGLINAVITQNVDGLHKKAGSQNVIELHGSLREIYCLSCNKLYIAPEVPHGDPPFCECGGILKPNTVLFGEPLPHHALEAAHQAAAHSEIMLLIGTSAVVYPAAFLPHLTKENDGVVVEINPEPSFVDPDFSLNEPASRALSGILAALQRDG